MTPQTKPETAHASNAGKRRGVVLVAVLVVVVLLSLAGYQYTDMMVAEYAVSENAHRSAQSRALADSGVHYAAAMLSNPDNFYGTLGGNPFDNPDSFKDVPIELENGKKGFFSLIAPADTAEGGSIAYGVMDEGGKINLNALMKIDPSGDAALAVLIKLPNMTEEIANAIIDWMDGDSEVRPGGAENAEYAALKYRAKNGPIESIDELLLVKGVTRELLYGTDWNRNGSQDENEAASASFDRGWSAFLTAHSREQNYTVDGMPFIHVNNTDLEQLQTSLREAEIDEDLVKFVLMYKQYGPASSSGGQQSLGSSLLAAFGLRGGSSNKSSTRNVVKDLASYEVKLTKAGNKKIKSIFDLVEASVSIPGPTDPKTRAKTNYIYESPLNDPGRRRELLPKLFAAVTLVDPTVETEIPPRVNVNTAPYEVLAALPELTEADVEKIATLRPAMGSGEVFAEIYQTPAWLSTEAQIDVKTLRKLDNYVTTRTQVFRVQSVGYFEGKGPAVRVEAVIDTNGGRPRIVAWRNMTDLGKGWTSEVNP